MSDFQRLVEAKGKDIFSKLETDSGSIFKKDFWYGRIMDWSMKNAAFKTQMFRFVDVLPSLQSGSEVGRHLKEYFSQSGEELPSIFNFGLGIGSLAPGLMAPVIRKNVTEMAKMFIAGESPEEALPVLKKARKNKIGFTVDILGEACLSEQEAKEYQKRYLQMIDWLSKDAQKWEQIEVLDTDFLGAIPRVNISVKITALYSKIKSAAYEYSKEKVKERLRPVFDAAMANNVFINIDMEKYDIKDLTIDVFKELLSEPAYKNYRHFGLVVQCYLRESYQDLQGLVEFAKTRGTPFSLRLVKGAYWDGETINAVQHYWPVPVYLNKKESDANYEKCARLMLENYNYLSLCIGSHNIRTIAACLVMAEQLRVPKNAFEIQMLYGMADSFKKAFVKEGYRVREYAPIGELLPGMAYLVRRLLENTSNQSFLRSKFAENVDDIALLTDPAYGLVATESAPKSKPNEFINEPLKDFSKKSNREAIEAALKNFRAKSVGRTLGPVIEGKNIKTQKTLRSINPSLTSEVLGEVYMASNDDAEKAIQSAKKGFASWSKTPAETRAQILEKVADIFNRDRFEIMAAQILEAGKTWKEADGDIAEAIDFLRYYARDMRKLAQKQKVGNVPGENSLYEYKPRGVSVVIAPWNFPLAILTGMVGGALVTGNTVVFKPAEQTMIIGEYLIRALLEAGAPKDTVHFVPGYGEEVGAYLAAHKDTALICFTGSKEVGLKLIDTASRVVPGQKQIKKCIAEMGGKNALIIDNDADPDESVLAVLYSAFGFQGQKCSAASRVIVLDEIYDRFVERLEESALSLKVGPSEDPSNDLGPVIDEQAYQKIKGLIQVGEKEGRRLPSPELPGGGYFVAPTIFVDVKANARIAQEEIFGPVIAIIRAKDMDHAIEIANSTEYALTGGLFSRSPGNIEKVKSELEAGNVYINRGITGAMVDRHPFGGYRLSGVGYKTGGPEYLKQFLQERVVIENTVRRGFAPEEDGPLVGM